MNIKTKLNVEDIADALANSGDDTQAKFFNTFFKSLDLACETEYRSQMQLVNITTKLTVRAKKRINFLYDEEL